MGFIKEMLALGTIPAYASLACIAVFALYVIWHTLAGFRRGFFRQLIHTGFVLVSAVAAFIGSSAVCSFILNLLDDKTVENIVLSIENLTGVEIPEAAVKVLSVFDVQAFEHVLMLPLGVVIMPFVFMLLFFVIDSLLKTLYLLTIGIFRIGKSGTLTTKLTGLFLGAIEGVAVATLMLLPFAGVSDIAEDAYDMIVEANEEHGFEETKAEKIFLEYLEPFSKNPVLGFVDAVGSDIILDKLATFEDGDTELNMREEVSSVVRFAFVDAPAFKNTDWLNLTDNDKEVIDDVVDFVSESNYKASIVAEILSAIESLVDVLGIPEGDGSIDVVVAFFDVFDNIERDELPEVLNTFKEFYFIASDEAVLSGFATGDRELLTNAFSKKDENGKSSLNKMTDVLNENERTSVLVKTLTKMTITVLSNSMGLDEDAITKYNDVKSEISSTLSAIDKSKPKEEQISDVSASLSETFAKNGMTVEDGAVDNMAKYIVDNYGASGSISDDDFNSIMLNYYQANKDHISGSNE